MFISSSISEFPKLPPFECNRKLFDHFFNPYIFLNLEEFYIPISPYSSLDPIVHPCTIVVMFSTSNSIICFIISVSCKRYYLLSPVVVVPLTSNFVVSYFY